MDSNPSDVKGNPSDVKGKRRYDSNRRRQQALGTRVAVLDAAGRLFLADGYAPTTIASIAEAAGVSVETVYKGFGGKAGLVRAIWEQGLAGEGPVHAETRSDDMSATESDPRTIIENWGALTTEVAPRASPILLLVRAAAASDPEMAALLNEVNASRLHRMERNARRLQERGGLRDGVGLEHARDVMWAYTAPELYELLVLLQGWSPQRFGRFVAEGLAAALLPVDSA